VYLSREKEISMKNKIKFLGFIAVMALISFSMAACDTGGGGGGSNSVIGTSVQGNTLRDKLNWLKDNAQSDTSYTITADKDETLYDPLSVNGHIYEDIKFPPEDKCNELIYTGKDNITILLTGGKTIDIAMAPLKIGSGVTLILDNIIIQTYVEVYGALEMKAKTKIDQGVRLESNSTFTMNGGETLQVKNSTPNNNSTFTMNGGKISGNSGGSGVDINKATFIMNGGEISGNRANGLDITGPGTFTMNGGKISGNNRGVSVGGVGGTTFTMTGGEISGNDPSDKNVGAGTYGDGGGVYLMSGNFIMSGGKISGNNAGICGGGVYMSSGGTTFTMSGGEISGNNAGLGGGLYMNNGTFTMTGGTISGNTASRGGGVSLSGGNATFTKSGGTITGYDSDPQNGNAVKDSSGVVQSNRGHAVSIDNSLVSYERRETTAGPSVALDSSKSGAEGGWE
jgi:predicted small secreted protein